MKTLISIAMILVSTQAFAGSVTLTTYYPAPTGNYDKLNVSNGLNNDGKDFTVGKADKSNNTFHGNNTIGEVDKKTVLNGEVDLGTSGKNINIQGTPLFGHTLILSHGIEVSTSDVSEKINIKSDSTFTSNAEFQKDIVLGRDSTNFVHIKGNAMIGGNGSGVTLIDGTNILANNTQIQGSGVLSIANVGGLDIFKGVHAMAGANIDNSLKVNGNSNLGNSANTLTVIKGKINLDDGSSATSEAELKVTKVDDGKTKGYYAVYAP